MLKLRDKGIHTKTGNINITKKKEIYKDKEERANVKENSCNESKSKRDLLKLNVFAQKFLRVYTYVCIGAVCHV